MLAEISTENGELRTENQAPGTGHQGASTGNREWGTEDSTARSAQGERRRGRRGWRTSDMRDGRPVTTDTATALAPWPQAVPIVEVGTRVRTPDDQGGMVVDVMDCHGMLTYLVQLDGQARAQFIPARMLKGAQL